MKKEHVFFGWKMMPAIWMIYFLGCGPSVYGISMLSTNLVLNYGWNENVIGLASSVVQYAIAVLSFLVTFYIRKRGYKSSIILGGIVGTAGFFLLTVFHVSPAFYIAMMAAAGFCDAFSCLTTIPGLINNWFERNKALPMSLVLCSGAVAGFVMPVLAAQLSGKSITLCLAVYTAMSLAIVILGKYCIVDFPEQVGEVKDGHAWIKAHPDQNEESPKEKRQASVSVNDCYRSKPFLVLLMVMIAFRSMHLIFSTFIVIYAIRNGSSTTSAAILLTAGNMAGMLGRLCGGAVNKLHISYHVICSGLLALLGVSGVMIYSVTGYRALLLASVLLGFCFGFLQTLFPLLLSVYFGQDNFSALYGMYNMLGGIFSGTLPIIIAAVIPWFGGDYRYMFLMLAFLAFLAAVLSGITPAGLIRVKTKKV